ncbi:uncharacterized protein TRIVIDRAFT_49737 [Trichoderma virens Gv29-8]|uniref:Subtilisin-like serine protease n=1 Tax=Hypocrea virens (strain Gv29-8 / FGSC 10586) TaxID=413071 RepID=G9MY27_HYPVG|nr:uncharacterized protein TRIVIDRAFT_49737 [Trichoderma virens Gv29-8]EHK20787.1 hypothetical protein TRIVIDRAFT_49737 [Trichoderma virens Gv29-8]UKZ57078.1 hypothetical protein TrVGV298_010930 [Trichoderma virens]UKZ82809.1 hypothetical protein TrVFT333_010607 [Trichoderma virens FT-333]
MEKSPPFTIELVDPAHEASSRDVQDATHTHLARILPATTRSTRDEILNPTSNLQEFLQQELLVRKINAVQDWLWACGRPMPPRPLHHQRVLSRDIIITENPELHLIWGPQGIHLKPLPEYLLDSAFWQQHILSSDSQEQRIELEQCARGFLFSYCALIAHYSDFRVAREKGLLPEAVTWEYWKMLSGQILQHHCYSTVNPRYWYGELRLGRLNKIYRFRKGHLLRGYSRISGYAIYGDLIRDNFASLITILGYVVIVLTAMQVGLATDKLISNSAFQAASYGLAIFSIIAPLISAVAILLFVSVWIVSNWRATMDFERRRFVEMGVEPYWRDKY